MIWCKDMWQEEAAAHGMGIGSVPDCDNKPLPFMTHVIFFFTTAYIAAETNIFEQNGGSMHGMGCKKRDAAGRPVIA